MIFSCHADGQQHLYIEHNSCCCCPYSVIMLARCYHDVATTTYFRHIGATSLCDISQLSGSRACRLYTQCDRSAGRPASPRKGARQRLPELAGKRPETSRPKRQGLARLLAGEGCRRTSRRPVGRAAQMLRERRFWRCCRQASRSKLAARLGWSYG